MWYCEIANHLGNVLTTVSNRKKGIARTGSVTKVGTVSPVIQTKIVNGELAKERVGRK